MKLTKEQAEKLWKIYKKYQSYYKDLSKFQITLENIEYDFGDIISRMLRACSDAEKKTYIKPKNDKQRSSEEEVRLFHANFRETLDKHIAHNKFFEEKYGLYQIEDPDEFVLTYFHAVDLFLNNKEFSEKLEKVTIPKMLKEVLKCITAEQITEIDDKIKNHKASLEESAQDDTSNLIVTGTEEDTRTNREENTRLSENAVTDNNQNDEVDFEEESAGSETDPLSFSKEVKDGFISVCNEIHNWYNANSDDIKGYFTNSNEFHDDYVSVFKVFLNGISIWEKRKDSAASDMEFFDDVQMQIANNLSENDKKTLHMEEMTALRSKAPSGNRCQVVYCVLNYLLGKDSYGNTVDIATEFFKTYGLGDLKAYMEKMVDLYEEAKKTESAGRIEKNEENHIKDTVVEKYRDFYMQELKKLQKQLSATYSVFSNDTPEFKHFRKEIEYVVEKIENKRFYDMKDLHEFLSPLRDAAAAYLNQKSMLKELSDRQISRLMVMNRVMNLYEVEMPDKTEMKDLAESDNTPMDNYKKDLSYETITDAMAIGLLNGKDVKNQKAAIGMLSDRIYRKKTIQALHNTAAVTDTMEAMEKSQKKLSDKELYNSITTKCAKKSLNEEIADKIQNYPVDEEKEAGLVHLSKYPQRISFDDSALKNFLDSRASVTPDSLSEALFTLTGHLSTSEQFLYELCGYARSCFKKLDNSDYFFPAPLEDAYTDIINGSSNALASPCQYRSLNANGLVLNEDMSSDDCSVAVLRVPLLLQEELYRIDDEKLKFDGNAQDGKEALKKLRKELNVLIPKMLKAAGCSKEILHLQQQIVGAGNAVYQKHEEEKQAVGEIKTLEHDGPLV